MEEKLYQIFSEEYELDDIISYKQWLTVDGKANLMTCSATVQEFVDATVECFERLKQHHFIAKAQASYLTDLKENLPANEAIVLLDFAENYSFIAQDVVQSHHWNNAQATLHPFVVYYRDPASGELKHLNLCVISDEMKHDTLAVHAFLSKLTDQVKEKLPFITKLHYFSDGCGGQYKNFKNFANL